MRIDLEEFEKWLEWKQKVNSTPLQELEFYKNGKSIKIDEKYLEEFKFTGLSNILFIEIELYGKHSE